MEINCWRPASTLGEAVQNPIYTMSAQININLQADTLRSQRKAPPRQKAHATRNQALTNSLARREVKLARV